MIGCHEENKLLIGEEMEINKLGRQNTCMYVFGNLEAERKMNIRREKERRPREKEMSTVEANHKFYNVLMTRPA